MIDWYASAEKLEVPWRPITVKQSDFCDLWAADPVVFAITEHILTRIPHELPPSLLRVVCAFVSAMFDENIAREFARMDWAVAALAAVNR